MMDLALVPRMSLKLSVFSFQNWLEEVGGSGALKDWTK